MNSKQLMIPKHLRGLTLVELMVALTTGLLLLGGVIQVFLGMQEANRLQEQQTRLQESMRFASDLLGRQFRMAGFWGCADPNDTNFDFTNHINAAWTASLPGTYNGPPAASKQLDFNPASAGSLSAVFGADNVSGYMTNPWGQNPDTITIAGALTPSMRLNADVTGTTDIDVNVVSPNDLSNTAFSARHTVILSDCSKAALFHVTNDPTSADWERQSHAQNSASYNDNGGASSPISFSDTYEALDSQILVVREYQFALRDDLTGGAHLYRFDFGQASFEALIPGAVGMQIEYGVDTVGNDGVVDTFVPASQVPGWANVLSIRVALLLRSDEDNLVEEPQSFYYIDASDNQWKTMTAPDLHRYRVLIKTVAIRTRID